LTTSSRGVCAQRVDNAKALRYDWPGRAAMTIIGVEKLTDAAWLNLFRVTYQLEGSRQRSWTLASRRQVPRCASGRFDSPDAVIIAAYHSGHHRLVVIREYRAALAGDEYGFPAGLVEPGERIEEAARRELREETGLRLVRVLETSPPLYSSAGMTDESICLVFAECDGDVCTALQESSEQIEVMFVSPGEADRMCRDPSLKFYARAWLILSRFAATGRIAGLGGVGSRPAAMPAPPAPAGRSGLRK
jgi:ADP-ribose pyrophosphatase